MIKKKISIILLILLVSAQLGFTATYRTECGVVVQTISRVEAYIDGWSMDEFEEYLLDLDEIFCP
ncbi:hypothetical protein JS578_02410 [Dysgonomonadaceae bacterium zrk40]|nr:hypothetical protein JS578_02410 [Dysgonomonadaceae bacterium zrk40]